jgi:hypothetical protein
VLARKTRAKFFDTPVLNRKKSGQASTKDVLEAIPQEIIRAGANSLSEGTEQSQEDEVNPMKLLSKSNPSGHSHDEVGRDRAKNFFNKRAEEHENFERDTRAPRSDQLFDKMNIYHRGLFLLFS